MLIKLYRFIKDSFMSPGKEFYLNTFMFSVILNIEAKRVILTSESLVLISFPFAIKKKTRFLTESK